MTPRHLAALIAVSLFGLPALARADSPNGLPTDIRSLAAIAPVRTDDGALALDTYRSLLPKGLSLPAQPAVGVWLADLSAGRSLPDRPYDPGSHWVEGAISLRVRHDGDGEEGWYPIHYPVTAEFWFQAGRAVGLPKRHADATMVADGTGWDAQATPTNLDGKASIVMDWQPADGGDPAQLRDIAGLPLQPMFPLNSPFAGPTIERVQYDVHVPYPFQGVDPLGAPPYPGRLEPAGGTVHLQLRTNLDEINEDLPKLPGGPNLGNVVAADQTVPGTYIFQAVTLGSSSSADGSGGYGG
jgi:Acetoacetate decarboxylase (ADC)